MGDIHKNSESSPKLDGKAPTADAAFRNEESTPPKRILGSMKGLYTLPENFEEIDRELDKEIERLFLGEDSE
jgi:hypothetical protein